MTFEEKYPVIKGTWLDRNLVFHVREQGFTRWLDADGIRQEVYSEAVVLWEVRTECGVLLDWWTRDNDSRGRYTTIRAELAPLIARPCRRCYEVEDDAASV